VVVGDGVARGSAAVTLLDEADHCWVGLIGCEPGIPLPSQPSQPSWRL
jgi:hypothetical protein